MFDYGKEKDISNVIPWCVVGLSLLTDQEIMGAGNPPKVWNPPQSFGHNMILESMQAVVSEISQSSC